MYFDRVCSACAFSVHLHVNMYSYECSIINIVELYLFLSFHVNKALECYHCDQPVRNFTECNTTRACNDGEVSKP